MKYFPQGLRILTQADEMKNPRIRSCNASICSSFVLWAYIAKRAGLRNSVNMWGAHEDTFLIKINMNPIT